MKLLTIGNSYSVNSCHYLDGICRDAGVELTLGRANIGGCSLERHWYNAMHDIPTYGDEYMGNYTLREMLESEKWDFVTLQQQSLNASKIGTFYPYIDVLADYVRKYAPSARLMMHQTWAYRVDNLPLMRDLQISQAQMFMLIKQNYNEIAERIGAGILPVGEALRIMQEETGDPVGRLTRKPDGPSHANELGEFIGGMTWYAALTGGDVDKLTYIPEEVDASYVAAAKRSVKAAAAMYNN